MARSNFETQLIGHPWGKALAATRIIKSSRTPILGLNWIGLDLLGLDWVGSDWIGSNII